MTNELGEPPFIRRLQELGGRAIAIVLLVALAVTIARAYIGHSPGPYGTCYGSSGRSIPCEVLSHK